MADNMRRLMMLESGNLVGQAISLDGPDPVDCRPIREPGYPQQLPASPQIERLKRGFTR
jgi:hypothetical protein